LETLGYFQMSLRRDKFPDWGTRAALSKTHAKEYKSPMVGSSSSDLSQETSKPTRPRPIGIVLLLLAVAVLWVVFHEQRPRPPFQPCINNLRQIDGAIQQWAIETRQPSNANPTWDNIRPYFANHPIPVCPDGGTYTLWQVANHPRCSIAEHNHAFDP
jgi:hypothetical protein